MLFNPNDLAVPSTIYTNEITPPTILEGSDLDLRLRAVEAGVSLYANKVTPSLKDYNTNLLDLITKIYNFYGTDKELH